MNPEQERGERGRSSGVISPFNLPTGPKNDKPLFVSPNASHQRAMSSLHSQIVSLVGERLAAESGQWSSEQSLKKVAMQPSDGDADLPPEESVGEQTGLSHLVARPGKTLHEQ